MYVIKGLGVRGLSAQHCHPGPSSVHLSAVLFSAHGETQSCHLVIGNCLLQFQASQVFMVTFTQRGRNLYVYVSFFLREEKILPVRRPMSIPVCPVGWGCVSCSNLNDSRSGGWNYHGWLPVNIYLLGPEMSCFLRYTRM